MENLLSHCHLIEYFIDRSLLNSISGFYLSLVKDSIDAIIKKIEG